MAGHEEVVSGFLWLPKRLAGEWRWLRRATWLRVHGSSWDGIYADDYYWLD